MSDELETNQPGRGGGFGARGVAGDDLTLVARAGFGGETVGFQIGVSFIVVAFER